MYIQCHQRYCSSLRSPKSFNPNLPTSLTRPRNISKILDQVFDAIAHLRMCAPRSSCLLSDWDVILYVYHTYERCPQITGCCYHSLFLAKKPLLWYHQRADGVSMIYSTSEYCSRYCGLASKIKPTSPASLAFVAIWSFLWLQTDPTKTGVLNNTGSWRQACMQATGFFIDYFQCKNNACPVEQHRYNTSKQPLCMPWWTIKLVSPSRGLFTVQAVSMFPTSFPWGRICPLNSKISHQNCHHHRSL